MNYRLILLVFFLLIACNITNESLRFYHIRPNEHLSRPFLNPSKVRDDVLHCKIKINASCNSYTPDCPEQINKVTGISARPFVRSDKSAMLGWNTLKDGTLKFWLFVNYDKSPRDFDVKFIMNAEVDTWYDLQVWAENSRYYLMLDNVVVSLPKADSDYNFWMIDPYFGGRCPNPSNSDCIITIEIID
jgi:hypothetical protein